MSETNQNYHHGDLRAALLGEAAAMLAEGGADAITMREIGRRLGVSRAAPYRHFKDKAGLLEAVATTGFQKLGERIGSVDSASGRAGVDRLRRVGEEYVRFALENPAHYRLMYGREALARRNLPGLRAAANKLFDRLVELIRLHQRRGVLKRQNAEGQAYAAWSAVHGLASLLIEGQIMADVDVDSLIKQTTRTIVDGMVRE